MSNKNSKFFVVNPHTALPVGLTKKLSFAFPPSHYHLGSFQQHLTNGLLFANSRKKHHDPLEFDFQVNFMDMISPPPRT